MKANLETSEQDKATLEGNNKDLQSKIDELTSNSENANLVKELQDKVASLKEVKTTLEASNKELQEKVNELTKKAQG
ncbi:hypothetical protein M1771_03710 [Spiroplasma citri]|uniref:Uncharacterized protein n=1 Tax=Spiroplasma citri TaxID=2133 RepID=A0AAX3T179_SPICI|nr:hypothetical protein [Spiroplasma citri]WFG97114.1 hypothetical protein M0C40_03700 [Spiroplasma citri]WFH01017.1 hypothetical protein M1771_03710 [Spiroplasma citri]